MISRRKGYLKKYQKNDFIAFSTSFNPQASDKGEEKHIRLLFYAFDGSHSFKVRGKFIK